MNGSRSLGTNNLGDDLIKMFDLPDDLSTIITGGRGELNAVAHEMLSRMSEVGQVKVGVAKMAYYLDRLSEHLGDQAESAKRQMERCDKIQSGETQYGCAHLENLKGTFWKFVAVSFCVPIVVALVITGIVWLGKL